MQYNLIGTWRKFRDIYFTNVTQYLYDGLEMHVFTISAKLYVIGIKGTITFTL